MKISILFPVFNTASFLRECLDSIIAQTEQDWELLAVDDFSTDESLVILEEYARIEKRIRVFQNEKKGIAPTLRLAFQKSTGALVTCMDSDDRMMPKKLAALKNVLMKIGKGHVATGLVEYFSADELGAGYRSYARWLNEVAINGTHAENIYRECVIPSPCWMAWREDLEAAGAFQEDIYPEDYDLCFRFLKAGFKIDAAPEVLHLWRDWPLRTSRTDELYHDNSFLDLKADWFARMDYDGSRPLVLWGAGRKGKRLAKLFTHKGISFHWVCDNAGKWGKAISGVIMENFEMIPSLIRPQIIVAVAGPEDQRVILEFLEKHSFESGQDYFFFC
jgi:glycosyltransferase involved in cell wall biosynthesis